MIVKKAKKLTKNPGTLQAFIFSFSLLQNSIDFLDFESIFINILHMFSNDKLSSSCLDSINKIRTRVRQRNMSDFSYIDFDGVDTPEEEAREHYFNDLESINLDSETTQSLKKFSPFKLYFDRLIESYNQIQKLGYDCSGSNTKPNDFYCPQLIDLLMKYTLKCRLTNNYVENYFGFLKKTLFKKKLKMKPSEFTAPLYRHISVKIYFALFYGALKFLQLI